MKNKIKLALSFPGDEPLYIYCYSFMTLPSTNQLFVRFDDDEDGIPSSVFLTEFKYGRNLGEFERGYQIYKALNVVATSETTILITGINGVTIQASPNEA